MNLFLSAVGITAFLLAIFASFNYGRQLEADAYRRAEKFAKSAITEYHDHLVSSYYASDSQRRWMMQCPAPQLPTMPEPEHGRRRRTESYNPADDPEFVERFHSNGQATIYYKNSEGRPS